jgi:hypothetical protein
LSREHGAGRFSLNRSPPRDERPKARVGLAGPLKVHQSKVNTAFGVRRLPLGSAWRLRAPLAFRFARSASHAGAANAALRPRVSGESRMGNGRAKAWAGGPVCRRPRPKFVVQQAWRSLCSGATCDHFGTPRGMMSVRGFEPSPKTRLYGLLISKGMEPPTGPNFWIYKQWASKSLRPSVRFKGPARRCAKPVWPRWLAAVYTAAARTASVTSRTRSAGVSRPQDSRTRPSEIPRAARSSGFRR